MDLPVVDCVTAVAGSQWHNDGTDPPWAGALKKTKCVGGVSDMRVAWEASMIWPRFRNGAKMELQNCPASYLLIHLFGRA